jgi:hypothetical protein
VTRGNKLYVQIGGQAQVPEVAASAEPQIEEVAS